MKLLIWGIGKLTKKYMREGYFCTDEIVGFVDTYKSEESFMDYPVFKPDEVLTICYDMLLVCVLRNNRDILKLCVSKGIDMEKLFFIHCETFYDGVREEPFVSRVEQIKKDYPMIAETIAEQRRKAEYNTYNNFLDSELEDTAVIKKIRENFVVVLIPIELLFSEKRTNMQPVKFLTEEWEKQNAKYQDLPIISFQPYRNLFQFFSNGRELPDKYCRWFQYLFESRGIDSGYSDEMLIEKRFREYRMMRDELQRGLDFFVEHPATAVWNEMGYFNLQDGHHRVFFLYNSGYYRIPVQIKRSDYDIWCNRKAAQRVKDIIQTEMRIEFYQPILNPYFFRIHPYRDETVKNRLHLFLEYVNNRRFREKKVLDIGANIGYFGYAFARLGAKVTLMEPDPYHYELTEAVKEMLYVDAEVVTCAFEEYKSDEVFDIAIMLTVFYRYMPDQFICEKFMEHLNQNVSQMLFWESGDEIEREKQFLIEHTKFKNFVHLGYTYGTGKLRELGLFIADNSEYL